MLLVVGLNNSHQAVRWPARLVMPVRFSACSSLIQSGANGGKLVRTELGAPGVVPSVVLLVTGAGLIEPLVKPEPERRTVRGPPLVLAKYQKLTEYGWLRARAGEIV